MHSYLPLVDYPRVYCMMHIKGAGEEYTPAAPSGSICFTFLKEGRPPTEYRINTPINMQTELQSGPIIRSQIAQVGLNNQ